tara:strand:- start:1 stop:498 length:498 start_codon:yes stop_codon:yes gene_type:complete
MKYYNNIYALKIQSCYKGYKTRKYLNNIYNRLPKDIQNHILYFMKKDFYIEKLNKKLELIVENKINNYIIDFNNNLIIDENIPFTLLNYLNNNQTYILHIYKLFTKYNSILTNKIFLCSQLYKNLVNFSNLLYNYKNKIFNFYTNHLYELANTLCIVLNGLLIIY